MVPREGVSGNAEAHQVAKPSMPAHRVNASGLLKTRPVAATTCFGLHSSPLDASQEPLLLMSIPRRVLRRAVDRNTVKRLARERLRLIRKHVSGAALLLRLKRIPTGFSALSERARKAVWRAELKRVFSLGVGHA